MLAAGHPVDPGGRVHRAKGHGHDLQGQAVRQPHGQARVLRQAQAAQGQAGGPLRRAPLRRYVAFWIER